jgi:3'(2'), 5'-bisphosphate nucleotidase
MDQRGIRPPLPGMDSLILAKNFIVDLNMINKDYDIGYLLDLAAQAALSAGGAIMEVYGKTEIAVEKKSDDSPVTEADLCANAVIFSTLESAGLPVLSEEGREIPFGERKHWKLFWLVDPLDGTREFIDRNGEFTVNIALIEAGMPVAGVVYVPVRDILYAGIVGVGAMRFEGASGIAGSFTVAAGQASPHSGPPGDKPEKKVPHKGLPLPCVMKTGLDIAGSRSFMDERTLGFIREVVRKFPGSRMITRGGALKFCMVAEGSADIYPRFSNIREWDTAAGHAIILAAGGKVVLASNTDMPLRYNKERTVNPWFIAFRDKALLTPVSGLIPCCNS